MRRRFSALLKHPGRTPLTFRLFLLYAVLLVASGVIATRQVMEHIKPAVRQSTEETLVDTANLLAELVREGVALGTLQQSDLSEALRRYGERRPDAQIWGIEKSRVHHRIYVVDRHGIVLVDSTGRDVGQDYSRWNDVYFTLRGQYGARSTKDDPHDELSSVMYVAAPVYDGGQIIGAVTVGKPNRTALPFLHRARQRLERFGLVATLLGLAVGAALALWLSRTIRRLTHFANAVAEGKRAEVPSLPGGELRHLAESLDTMREELEGKAYVERYVHTLTHELKSPLSAIVGATELLQDSTRSERDVRLLTNIQSETARLRSLTERLLGLAELEQRQTLAERIQIPIGPLFTEIRTNLASKLEASSVQLVGEIRQGKPSWASASCCAKRSITCWKTRSTSLPSEEQSPSEQPPKPRAWRSACKTRVHLFRITRSYASRSASIPYPAPPPAEKAPGWGSASFKKWPACTAARSASRTYQTVSWRSSRCQAQRPPWKAHPTKHRWRTLSESRRGAGGSAAESAAEELRFSSGDEKVWKIPKGGLATLPAEIPSSPHAGPTRSPHPSRRVHS